MRQRLGQAVRADNNRAAIAPRLDPENQLAILEPREAKEPVARPELSGPELGLLGAHDTDVEFVRSVHLSVARVVLGSLSRTTDRSRQPAAAEVGELRHECRRRIWRPDAHGPGSVDARSAKAQSGIRLYPRRVEASHCVVRRSGPLFRGSSVGSTYPRPSGPIAVT